jgi:hypothetical protein
VVTAGRVEAFRSPQCVHHACLEIRKTEAVLLIPRYLLRQLTPDCRRIAQRRCAVLMVQYCNNHTSKARSRHREPHIQPGSKEYDRLKVELVRVHDAPHLVELVPTWGSIDRA